MYKYHKSRESRHRRVPAKGDLVRDRILSAALRLFRKKGYLGTSMTEIADAVHLTKGGIYHYIGKKEDLLRELHDAMIDAVDDRYQDSVEPEPDPGKKLVNWITIHASIMHDYLDQIAVFFTEIEHLDKKTLKRMIERRDEVHRRLADIIRMGVDLGNFRKGMDPDIAAFLILGTLNWFYQWYRPSGKRSLEEITNMTIHMVCHGVCVGP